MSVQKTLAEAEKYFDKGKFTEAIDKFKQVLAADPLHQLAATKLATIYIQKDTPVDASKVFAGLAKRLSDAGKAQVAIAFFKQALDLNENDVDLKFKFSQECESAGKIGEAAKFAKQVLDHYLSRKKYFDAANVMPLLIRCYTRDESNKKIWIDVLRKSQAEDKIVHLLVGVCGPPGLASPEFPTGGDPAAFSEEIYRDLIKLIAWFPKDPRVSYALAWCAYRRQKWGDFFGFLKETFRRDPDFCLGMILFARYLAEAKKLNEAHFIFKYAKEKISSDKSVDLNSLNRQFESFVEKNAWLNFLDGMDEKEMDSATFLKAIVGDATIDEKDVESAFQRQQSEKESEKTVVFEPEEIELNLNALSSSEDGPLELQLAGGQTRLLEMDLSTLRKSPDAGAISASAQPTTPNPTSPVKPTFTPIPEAPNQASPSAIPGPAPVPAGGPEVYKVDEGSVNFTMLIKKEPDFIEEPDEVGLVPEEEMKTLVSELLDGGMRPKNEAPLVTKESLPGNSAAEASPNIASQPNLETAQQKYNQPVIEALPDPQELIEANRGEDSTVLFSPFELIQAQDPNLTKMEAVSSKKSGIEYGNVSAPEESVNKDQATMIMKELGGENVTDFSGQTKEISIGGIELKELQLDGLQENALSADPQGEPPLANIEELIEEPDLGDDLLAEPTRVLVAPQQHEETLFLSSGKSDAQNASLDLEGYLRKADRYVAKRKYHLARKALRNALYLGGNEEAIKEKLREVRNLELPQSLYAQVSSDSKSMDSTDKILEKLELEFNLSTDSPKGEEFFPDVVTYVQKLCNEHDFRTLVDLGIAFHEMALFVEAETLFSELVNRYPEDTWDTYYLAALAKFAKKDYAGSVSILKKLSSDSEKPEIEKISIYYTLGEVFEKMHQASKSKEAFEKVASLDSNYRNIREKLGN